MTIYYDPFSVDIMDYLRSMAVAAADHLEAAATNRGTPSL
jgi:hypothetical protein